MSSIFEQPWTLLIIAIIALPVLLMFRRISPEKSAWWQWLLPPFLAVAALGLDYLVQTDLEKINAVINTAVKAVEEENPDAIEAIISENYHDSYHNTKKVLMYYCRDKLSPPLVEKNIARIMATQISQPDAIAIFTVRTVFDKRSHIYQSFKSQTFTKVQIGLQKEPDGSWLINRAELLELDRRPASWQDIKQASW